MTTLLVTRHAQSHANSSGYLSSAKPGPDLTDLGRTQAERWAASMLGHDVEAVYCSPYVRTRATAQALAARLGHRTVNELDDLSEFDIGNWEGRHGDDPDVRNHSVFRAWLEGERLDEPFQSGETAIEVRDRAARAFAAITSQHDARATVAVVTHGGFMAIALPLMCQSSISSWSSIPANAETRIIRATGTGWVALPESRRPA